MLGNLSRAYILMAFPRVLHVGILRRVIPLHLDMGGDIDIFPCYTAVIFFFKSFYRRLVIPGIMKFPQSVQTFAKRAFPLLHFLYGGIISVIRMGHQSFIAKIFRFLYKRVIKKVHLLSSLFYFTSPVIPSANCFCSTKNTIIVGIEQNSTPHISIP